MSTTITLSGMTGSGKTTIARELLRELPDAFMVPSTTDRLPRPDDIPGEYDYLTKPEMQDLKLRSRGTRKDKIRTLWTEERKSGHSYVTIQDVVEAAIARDGYGIMILVPTRVETLYYYLEHQREESASLIPFFIKSPGLGLLRDRVSSREQNIADFEAVWPEEQAWEAFARKSVAGFTFIDNDEDGVEAAVSKIVQQLGQTRNRSRRSARR